MALSLFIGEIESSTQKKKAMGTTQALDLHLDYLCN